MPRGRYHVNVELGSQAHAGDGHLGVVRVEPVAKDLSELQGLSVVGKRRGQRPRLTFQGSGKHQC